MACRFNRLSAFSTPALMVASMLVLSACDRNNSSSGDGLIEDDPNAVLVPPLQTDVRGINVLVQDQTGAKLDDVTVLVLNDELNGDLVDDELETLIAEDGTTRVSVSATNDDAIVRLEAEKEGYFSNGARYVLPPGLDLNAIIVLTAIDTDEAGIRVAGIDGDLSQGSLTVNAVSQDDPENTLTSVTVPQDLEILDVDGNVLDESLRVSVVHFDSRDEQALTAFPGGFDVSVENVMDIDTQAIEGTVPSESEEPLAPNLTFQSVGFTAVEIFDSEGRKADTFTGAIDVTMAIPAGAQNPNTGAAIAVGDVIPVWSFDTDTADWAYEGNETVQQAANGGLQVVYRADHLSYWNLDFFTRELCDAEMNVTVRGSDNQVVDDTPITVTLLGSGEGNVGYRRQDNVRSGSIQLTDISERLQLSVRFASVLPEVEITSIELNGAPYTNQTINICEVGETSFSVVTNTTAAELEDALSFSYPVTVNTQCLNGTDSSTQPVPDIYSYFQSDDGSTFVQGRTNAQGNLTLSGEGNGEGAVYAYYNGRYVSQRVNQESDSASFTFESTCVVTTGAGGQ